MLLDAQNLFSDTPANGGDQPTSHSAATDSKNIIDLGANRDIGSAVTDELYLLCEVIAAFTSGGSATLQVQVQGAPDNAGAPGSYAVLYQSAAIPVASLLQGYKFLLGGLLSWDSSIKVRFLKLSYVIGTADMTAGGLVAGFVPALQHAPSYPRAYAA
jgi:hypothetical protein